MSIPQETIDLVWNRALELDSPDDAAASGDGALHTLMVFHGTVMNGGLLNAVESHAADETYPIDAVAEAYRFFDLESAAAVIERAATEQEALEANENDDIDDDALEEAEERINEMYHLEDSDIEDALTMALLRDPEAFAPVD